MLRNEPKQSLRTVPLFARDGNGDGVAGISWAASDVKLHKHGGSWVNSTNLPVETVGGAAGSYELPLSLAEVDAYGPLFYWVNHAGVKTIVSAAIIESEAGSFSKNELMAELRTIPLFIVNGSGDGVGGISWIAGDAKIHKNGGNWVNAPNLPVEVSAGPAGAYTMLLNRNSLDTYGPLFWQVTKAGVKTLVDAITVVDFVSTYRMRARSASLGRTVFWSAPIIDSDGSYYEGGGTLTDIVVQSIL